LSSGDVTGHGSTFVLVVGEILATTGHPTALFDPARFR